MKVTTIPKEFLNLALAEGVNEIHASDYYLRRVNGRSYYDIVLHVKNDFDANETQASRALNRLWKNWKSMNHTGTVVVNKEPIFVERAPAVANTKTYDLSEDHSFLDLAKNGLERIIGKINEVEGPKPTNRKAGAYSVDVAGDFHIPFHDEASLNYLLESDAEELILMGDFLDMLSATGHRQTCDFVTMQEELAVGRAILERLANKYRKIKVILGNHDVRPVKRMQAALPGLMPLLLHPMAWLTQGIKNVEFMSVTVPDTKPLLNFGKDYRLDFAGMSDGCLFGHFECFCGDDAAKKLDTWVAQWNHILKLPAPKAIFQAHTHRLAVEFTAIGRMLVSTGCMCKPQEYQFLQHGKYSPPVQGFVRLFKNEAGEFDLNKTQLIYTGA